MDLLGQLYLLSMIFGWGFIVGCFMLGQAGHGHGSHSANGHGGHGGDAGHIGGGHGMHNGGHAGHVGNGGHVGSGGHAGHVGQSGNGGHAGGTGQGAHGGHSGHGGDAAHSGQAGHSGAGGHNGHGGHAGHNGHSGHANHSNQEGGQRGIRGLDEIHGAHGLHESILQSQEHGSGHGGNPGHSDDASTSVNPPIRSRDNKFYFTLISVLNPMRLSTFTGFFGAGGFLAWHYAPWLGYMTLIPAGVSGVIATEVMKRAMSLLVSKLSSSSLIKQEDSIGRIAQVSTPISDGRLGEVSYVIGTSRFNASAKAAHPGETFIRGSKVMIVETEGPVVYVETAKDIDLEFM